MIDKQILDEVLPVPEIETLRDEKIAELKEAGFVISNFHSGGIFHTMLMIVLRIEIELLGLARLMLNNLFVSHATGAWLDLKMARFRGLTQTVRQLKFHAARCSRLRRISTAMSCASLCLRRRCCKRVRRRLTCWLRQKPRARAITSRRGRSHAH